MEFLLGLTVVCFLCWYLFCIKEANKREEEIKPDYTEYIDHGQLLYRATCNADDFKKEWAKVHYLGDSKEITHRVFKLNFRTARHGFCLHPYEWYLTVNGTYKHLSGRIRGRR